MRVRQVRIAPSILAADFSRLGEQVREAEAAGADYLHIDVMDGHFVPNISVGPMVVRALASVTSLPLHVHLMIEQPERYIEPFAEAGASLITVHVETCPHLHRTLEQIRATGATPAVTLNPATPLCTLEEVLDQVGLVLIMTVDPGFGGQCFIPQMLPKVARLRETLQTRGLDECLIEVDGGVNLDTLPSLIAAGADVLVMGTAIFQSPEGITASIKRCRAAIATALANAKAVTPQE